MHKIRSHVVVTGPNLSEPLRIVNVESVEEGVKLTGEGLNTNTVHQLIITQEQIASLTLVLENEPSDSDDASSNLPLPEETLSHFFSDQPDKSSRSYRDMYRTDVCVYSGSEIW